MAFQLDQIAVLSFVGLLVWAAVSDGARFIIPNRVCAAIAVLYPVHVLASPEAVQWLPAVAIGVTAMVVGAFAFARGWSGGGDVKLFATSSLWAGPALFSSFVLVTAIAGGVLALGAMLLWFVENRRTRARGVPEGPGGTASGQDRPMLPYGIAIALGGTYVAVQLLRG